MIDSKFDDHGMYMDADWKPPAPRRPAAIPAMKLYLVRDHTGRYFNWTNGPDPWGPLSEARIYRDYVEVENDGWTARPAVEVIEIDTLAPIRILRELFETGHLEDHFYAIRENEGQGWEGPQIVRWGKAVEAAKKLMENL
jgi:hypothetical protein